MNTVLKTTLNTIRSHSPCSDGWATLLRSLGKTTADDTEVSLVQILDSNGIRDAIWALRCFDYRDYCLALADVAEAVLYIYESNYSSDTRVRDCICAIRQYHKGEIAATELRATTEATKAADAAAAKAAADDANAWAAWAARAAWAAAWAATARVAWAAADAAARAAGGAAKGEEIEQLFRRHFE